MQNFRKGLKEQEKILKNAESFILEELAHAPEGKLKCGQTKGFLKYYFSLDENKPSWEYLPKEKIKMAQAIAQKEYYKKILPQIKYNLKLIRQLVEIYEADALENIYSKLCSGRKALVKPLFKPVDELIKKWENIQYEPKPFAEGQSEFLTLRGERVRSKSEKMIADELYSQGIPYLYEYPLLLTVNGKTVEFRPDFVVLNKRTGQRYIIEHLGKMDDADYYNNTLRKLDAFEQNNLLIGRDVLLFHESQKNPLNVTVVRQYIQEYLA